MISSSFFVDFVLCLVVEWKLRDKFYIYQRLSISSTTKNDDDETISISHSTTKNFCSLSALRPVSVRLLLTIFPYKQNYSII